MNFELDRKRRKRRKCSQIFILQLFAFCFYLNCDLCDWSDFGDFLLG